MSRTGDPAPGVAEKIREDSNWISPKIEFRDGAPAPPGGERRVSRPPQAARRRSSLSIPMQRSFDSFSSPPTAPDERSGGTSPPRVADKRGLGSLLGPRSLDPPAGGASRPTLGEVHSRISRRMADAIPEERQDGESSSSSAGNRSPLLHEEKERTPESDYCLQWNAWFPEEAGGVLVARGRGPAPAGMRKRNDDSPEPAGSRDAPRVGFPASRHPPFTCAPQALPILQPLPSTNNHSRIRKRSG